jgi:hypothetical protein
VGACQKNGLPRIINKITGIIGIDFKRAVEMPVGFIGTGRGIYK